MSDSTAHILSISQALISHCIKRSFRLAVAESCTGGLLATTLTSLPGASRVFERGYVTYSNAAKIDCLGISPDLINKFGAVSAEVAIAMVKGLSEQCPAHVLCSITGVAGPGGGSKKKPVGTVFIGIGTNGGTNGGTNRSTGELDKIELDCHAYRNLFSGDRNQIRQQSIITAMELMNKQLHQGKLWS